MDMEFRIEHKDAFRVVGLVIHTTSENNLCRNEVPSLWGEVIQSNMMNEIMELSNQSPSEIMGISVYNTDHNDSKKFDYYIASATSNPVKDGLVEYTVPSATWAVFPC